MCKVPRYFSKVRPHLSRNIFLDFPNLSGNTESKEQNSNIFAVFKARLEELLVNKRKRGLDSAPHKHLRRLVLRLRRERSVEVRRLVPMFRSAPLGGKGLVSPTPCSLSPASSGHQIWELYKN
jgi:hypothetical protein